MDGGGGQRVSRVSSLLIGSEVGDVTVCVKYDGAQPLSLSLSLPLSSPVAAHVAPVVLKLRLMHHDLLLLC